MKPHILASTILIAAAPPALGQPLARVRIEVADAEALAASLEAAGFDVLEGGVRADSLEVIAGEAEIADLRRRGLAPAVLDWSRPFLDVQAERIAAGDGPGGYPTLAEIEAEMAAAAATFPQICKLVDVTAAYGTPNTFEGRHIRALKISDNVNADEDEPAVLIVSCHHAREIVTPVIALDALDRLTTLYQSDPAVTAAVNAHEIWIIPIANPDGYNHVFTVSNFWRKNRRVFPQGIGVDQNRNYPLGWSAPCSGSTSVSSDTYKGPSAASEAETQTIMTLSVDRHFAKVLDFHSSGREVLWEYNCLTHPFASFLQQQAIALSIASGYGGQNRAPSAEGEEQEWQFAHRGAFAFLTETHTTFQPTFQSAQAEAALVWPGTLWLLQRPITVRGNVTNAVTGAPVVASISYVAVSNGETNSSEPRFGRYHCFLPAGPFAIQFSAPGFVPQAKMVTATANTEQVVNVALVPVGFCYADCNGAGGLTVADFGCFQTKFVAGDPYADCNGDGNLTVADFGCFQTKFVAGCP